MPFFQSCDFIVSRGSGSHWSSSVADSLLTEKNSLASWNYDSPDWLRAEPEDNLLTLTGQMWKWKLRELTCAGPGVSLDNLLDYFSCQETPVPCRPLWPWRQSLAPWILIISVAHELEMMAEPPPPLGCLEKQHWEFITFSLGDTAIFTQQMWLHLYKVIVCSHFC